jgi:hypothetical protein
MQHHIVSACLAVCAIGCLAPTLASAEDFRCIQGYVWREVVPTDTVCVTPEVRAQVHDDNLLAGQRLVPRPGDVGIAGGAVICSLGNGCPYPIPCKQGYVWREAIRDDYVCVLPRERTQAAEDNRQAQSRLAH